ncbi:hypothetical protein [Celeribacter neptunius]|uniref:Uncharacterized protein n=1 Tax=Celeribacter neptunius TaxID=588602 RepID=A0A1I3Y1I6_9RHOB|nr:hypothetical protein [Celeribacter neptunius]SFK25116.1 hypothetical protein SAMN04487991_4220 [Celeribacter neptunius]
MLRRFSSHINTIMGNVRALISDFERDVGRGYFANEEDITSQFAGRLKNILILSDPDFTIQCRAIVTKKTTEEPTLGADILVVISFDSPEISISKGFIAQAKQVEFGKSIGGSGPMNTLRAQCRNMLDHTPESYVWLYSKDSFRVQRAATAEAITTNKPDDALSHPFDWFFYDFLISMRGDPLLTLQNFPRLQGIIQELSIPLVLLISATSTGDDRPRGGGEPSPDSGPPDLDDLVRVLDGTPLEEWSSWASDWGRSQSTREEEQSSEQKAKPQQRVQLREN